LREDGNYDAFRHSNADTTTGTRTTTANTKLAVCKRASEYLASYEFSKDAVQVKSKITWMEKKWKEVDHKINSTGWGLTDAEAEKGMTIEDKVEKLFRWYYRLEEFFGERGAIRPSFVSEIGHGKNHSEMYDDHLLDPKSAQIEDEDDPGNDISSGDANQGSTTLDERQAQLILAKPASQPGLTQLSGLATDPFPSSEEEGDDPLSVDIEHSGTSGSATPAVTLRVLNPLTPLPRSTPTPMPGLNLVRQSRELKRLTAAADSSSSELDPDADPATEEPPRKRPAPGSRDRVRTATVSAAQALAECSLMAEQNRKQKIALALKKEDRKALEAKSKATIEELRLRQSQQLMDMMKMQLERINSQCACPGGKVSAGKYAPDSPKFTTELVPCDCARFQRDSCLTDDLPFMDTVAEVSTFPGRNNHEKRKALYQRAARLLGVEFQRMKLPACVENHVRQLFPDFG
ncbi:hypothetical protein HKX48_001942, partial [Thoreauomyces humboldtii]